jgi:hypothetical protein
VDNWKNITNSQNRVGKKSFGGTFCFSNCHIIGLDTGGLVFLVSGFGHLVFSFFLRGTARLWAISFLTEIQEPNVIWLNRLNTEEELGQVVQDSPGERVLIFTSAILQVTVSLVVEHLVGGEVHGGIQQLKDWKKRLKKWFEKNSKILKNKMKKNVRAIARLSACRTAC